MRKKPFGVMRGRFGLLCCMVVFLSATFPAKAMLAEQDVVSCPPFAGVQGVDKCASGDAKRTQQSLSGCVDKTAKVEIVQKVKKLQIPFIANSGQVDEQVRFYANTFGGTVFVTQAGEIVYALPDVGTQCLASLMHSPREIRDAVGMLHDDHVSDIMHPASWIVAHDKSEFQNPKSKNPDSKNPQSKIRSVVLKEQFVGAQVKAIQGEDPSVTKVNYFKGNDPSKWKTNISTYDIVNL